MEREEKCNICRAFTLYNDFLPPVSVAHNNWQYMSFGYYDGVSVGRNLFKNNEWSLKRLWDYNVHQGIQMNGSFSYRIMWGLRCETVGSSDGTNDECWDEIFWDRQQRKKYPFLFISLLQMKKPFQFSIDERKKLEEQLTELPKRRAITYLTLDNSDMILVLQCKSYADGAEIINSFHYRKDNTIISDGERKLNYSFTVASINKDVLSKDKSIARLKETIPYAYIYAIQKQPGGICRIRKMIEDALGTGYIDHSSAVLGCNDEVIVIKDVRWCDFLRLFQDNTGILNHSNPIYAEMLTGVTTIVGKNQNEDDQRLGQKTEQALETNNDDEILLSDCMRIKCQNVINSVKSACMDNVKRGIYQVINSLHKFETTPFSDYLFQTVLLPLNMVIDMADPKIWISPEYYYTSFYEFMKGVNLYAQNAGHTDRQFTQTPDMNIRIYDTPVKLNAFYNAFIYYLKTYLNSFEEKDENHEYEFLACPGVTNCMRVQELFKQISTTKRLFLVEMPENQIYNPEMMMVMLAHEVSHFVGTGVRNRKLRLKCAEEMLGKIIVKYFRAQVKQCILQRTVNHETKEFEFIDNEEYWRKTEDSIVSDIRAFVSDYPRYLKTKKFSRMNAENKELLKRMMEHRENHSELLHMYMIDAAAFILQDKKKERWSYLAEKDFLYWIEKDSSLAEKRKSQLKEHILNASGCFLSYDLWNEDALSAKSVIDMMIYFLKECFADLMAIMTLELSMAEYLNAILQSNEEKKTFRNPAISGLDIRSALVTCCMCYDDQSLGYTWSERELEAISAGNDEELKNLRKRILNFKEDYLDEGSHNRYEDATENRALDMMLDVDILEIMMTYLLNCKQSFAEGKVVTGQKGKAATGQQKSLVEIYHCLSENNVEKLTVKIQDYVDQYLAEIKVKNRTYAEESDKDENGCRRISE